MKDKRPICNQTQELQSVAERWIRQVWQEAQFDAIDQLHHPHFIDRDPAGRSPDRDGFKAGVTQLYSAFPDFVAVAEDIITEPARGYVVIRWTAHGTHEGEFLGQAPTGQYIEFSGIEILRIEEGLIIERWGEWDGIGLAQQLGALK